MNTDNAVCGMIHKDKGILKIQFVNDNNTVVAGHEIFKWSDPQSFAEKMAEFHRVPIHGGESMNFKTVKP
jgi:hypothetical protein